MDVGPFRLDEIVGVGGMGEVWKAHHHRHGTAVAIKVITSDRAAQQKYRQSFQREVQAVAGLNDPGVVAIYDYGEIEGDGASQPWYAMELAQTSLAQIVIENWATLQRILVEILDALAHAHARNVIHRDLKPENVLLTSDLKVKLTDFGMAHIVEFDTSTNRVFGPGGGTPDFMAPEQFRGEWRKFGPWTDLYALGCMGWELASGAPPFSGKNVVDIAMQHMGDMPGTLAPQFAVPDRYDVWLKRLLQKHPLDRYRRAADAQWALVHDVGESSDAAPAKHLRSRPNAPTGADTDEVTTETLDEDVAATQPMKAEEPPRKTRDTLEDPAQMTLQMTYGLTPPFPVSWRTEHSSPLVGGAGLGLFGIREIPFVGRQTERELVWRRLREVDGGGHNEVILTYGDAGVGRTRFAQWISRRAHELGAATVLNAVHGPIPNRSDGLAGAVMRFLGIEGVEQSRARDIVLDRLGPSFDASVLFDLLYRGGADDSHGTSTFAAPAQRYAAVERLLNQLSWERPIILVADDVQWGADTLLFIQHLLQARSRTLVLATVRNDSLPDRYWESQLLNELREDDGVYELQLHPLTRSEQRELIEQMLDLNEGLGDRVSERTQGFPLFAVQLVGDWVQRGVLEEGPAGFQLVDGADVDLPDDVYALWNRRIDELQSSLDSPHVRHTLEVAAVLGRGDDGEWPRVCAQLDLPIPDALVDQLVARRFASRDPNGWSFQHGMMREALERSALESDRAHAIYAACADTADPHDPYRLAEFQVRAGRLDDAIASLLEALRIGIHTVAVDQSLQLVDVITELLNDVDAEENDLRRGMVGQARVTVLRLRGSIQQAGDAARQLAEDATRFGWTRLRGEANVHLGILGEQTGEPTRTVLEFFDEALATFDELDDDGGRARAYRALAQYHLANGKADVASNLNTKALTLLESLDDEEGVVECLAALGASRFQEGTLEAARSRFEQAHARADQLGLRHFAAEAILGLGQIAWRQGAVAQAERDFRDALELWTSIGSHSAAVASVYVGLMHLDRLEFTAARRAFESALEPARSGAAPRVTGVVEAGMMATTANDDEAERYDEHFSALQSQPRPAGMEAANAVFLAGQVWARRGDRHRARRAYTFARNRFLALGAQKRADDVARAIGRLSHNN